MTSKSLSVALVDTYQKTTAELSNLLKITARDGTVLGLTLAEESITYDDGAGDVTYSAPIGMNSYAMETSADLAVDNTEVDILLADSGAFSDEQIAAGVLDYGDYIVYRINRLDHSEGHEVIDRGTIGIIKQVDGVAGVIELRSLQQQLKQTYGELDSLTCRAVFGSGGGGTCLFRGQCGFDAESLWQNHSVASVGAEADRIFTADSAPAVNGPNGALNFAPGLARWKTGDNAGLTSEIESVDGAVITLRFGTPYAIQENDELDLRPDCDKTWETCRDDYDNNLNFRGEPKIPVADERSQSVPSTAPIADSGPVIPQDPEIDPNPPHDPPDDPPDPPPAPEPSNDLVNPGFESGNAGWARGNGWTITGSQPRSGSWSAEFYSGNVPSPILQSTHFPVTPGTNISGSCYIKRSAGSSASGRCMLRWYDADDIEIGNSFGNSVSATSYSQSSVNGTAPSGTAFVSIGAEGDSGGVFGQRLFVDDFTWNH